MPACVVRPRPVAAPRLRLFVLHHAGGSASAFRGWVKLFPPDWDVCLLDAPGRGRLRGVPPVRWLPDLVGYWLAELDGELDVPFAVFGHSMGAIVGYAMTLALRSGGLPLPVWLGVSAHPGPRVPGNARMNLHALDSEALRASLGLLGGVPAEVIADDIVWSMVEPLLRSDLVLAETWSPNAGELVVPVPVTVFSGDADHTAGPVTMRSWARHTDRFLGARVFPGDHFYFRHDPAALVASIVADVEIVLSGQSEVRSTS